MRPLHKVFFIQFYNGYLNGRLSLCEGFRGFVVKGFKGFSMYTKAEKKKKVESSCNTRQ